MSAARPEPTVVTAAVNAAAVPRTNRCMDQPPCDLRCRRLLHRPDLCGENAARRWPSRGISAAIVKGIHGLMELFALAKKARNAGSIDRLIRSARGTGTRA